MELTKTDFVHFLQCPKSFWLSKHEPDDYPYGEFSAFHQKLVREGYEVEAVVRHFFEQGPDRNMDFQTTFNAPEGLTARADALEIDEAGAVTLYEIKSSTSVKTDTKHSHLKDACFQEICAERSGRRIDRVVIVHLNGDYVRDGEIDPSELLVFSDVTDRLTALAAETEEEIAAALEMMARREIDRDGCACRSNTRANHCDSFEVFNPDIPEPSVYYLPRLSKAKITELSENEIYGLRDLPRDFRLSAGQLPVAMAAWNNEPQINLDGVRRFLERLEFPLYFFDYETFATAIPEIDGTKPHGHIPVQYSLHVLGESGGLAHREYLLRSAALPHDLLKQLREDIGGRGSLISWHASFEKTRNRELAELFPEYAEFLTALNDRMVDLEDVFKRDYVDIRFKGSTSIKKVLPVICPKLSYADENVQDGASAMEAWQRLVSASANEAEEIVNDLLSYCKLDTFAMVGIYRFLQSLVEDAQKRSPA